VGRVTTSPSFTQLAAAAWRSSGEWREWRQRMSRGWEWTREVTRACYGSTALLVGLYKFNPVIIHKL
jgi:hypothetical protein